MINTFVALDIETTGLNPAEDNRNRNGQNIRWRNC